MRASWCALPWKNAADLRRKFPRPPDGAATANVTVHRDRLLTLGLFGLLAIAHSWPLASDLAHLSRLDNDDAALNTWIVAWTAHILPVAPWRLFEAPIFYPEAHTLAYADHLFVPSLLGAPLLWLGASPDPTAWSEAWIIR